MADKKNAQKPPKIAEAKPQRVQQKAVDDAGDDSFPASDPRASTTTHVAARGENEGEGAPALDDVRTANDATAHADKRGADAKAAMAEQPPRSDQSSDSPKHQGDKLAMAVQKAAEGALSH